MSARLSPADFDRLGKLLGMLGSDHDGERAAAGLKATQFLRDRDVTWADLVEAMQQSARGTHHTETDFPIRWRRDAAECLANAGLWSAREFSFLHNMAGKRRPPTHAQAAWLADLIDRVRHGRRAA